MTIDGTSALPEDALLGINTMLSQLSIVYGMLNGLAEKGLNVNDEQEELKILNTEICFIKEILEPRIKKYEILNLDILFKHFPLLVRSEDKRYYHELTNETPVITVSDPLDIQNELQKLSVLFQANFKFTISEQFCEEIFSFLISNKYISQKSNMNSFVNLFKLEAIESKDRILWIDKAGGRPSLKVLCRMFYWLTDHLTARQRFNTNYSILIPHYFKNEKGEFNIKSIPTIIHEINKELPLINPREILLEDELKKVCVQPIFSK